MPDERRDSPHSFGIRGMEERVAAIGGSFRMASRPGKGTIVSVRTPAIRNH